MIFNQIICKDLRQLFCDAVTEIFGNYHQFFDFLENAKYSAKYDCFLDGCGENYIINRETGEYINWYKELHLGRCITISTELPYTDIQAWIDDFLLEFKESGDKDE